MAWFSRKPSRKQMNEDQKEREVAFNKSYHEALLKIAQSDSEEGDLVEALRLVGTYYRGGGKSMPPGFNYDRFNVYQRLHDVALRLSDLMASDNHEISEESCQALRAIISEYDGLGPEEFYKFRDLVESASGGMAKESQKEHDEFRDGPGMGPV